MQRWRRLGRVVGPDRQGLSSAMLPTPLLLHDGRLRLYYGAVDASAVSRIADLEIELRQPTVAVSVATETVLDIGAPGSFDDNGVVPCGLLRRDPEIHLYYSGFQKQTRIPYTMLTGLATSADGGRIFQRTSRTPLLERSPGEPFFRTAAWLLPEPPGWRMWYVGGGGWVEHGGRLLPSYSLRTAVSLDGRTWPPAGEVCLEPEGGEEIGFGRPCVLREGDRYRMWYSIRSRRGYRLGYAESADGQRWRRLDALLDLGPPLAGFDDEMTCYSAVVRSGGDLLMYYNGNGYGRTGIGVAILEQD